ncbi:Alkyl hydroperoxide reductase subunit C/ Thiol specific antioxidant, partial [Corchorus capsularis]
ACAFRDSYEKFKKAGAKVVGISGDDTTSHKVTNQVEDSNLSQIQDCNLNQIQDCNDSQV